MMSGLFKRKDRPRSMWDLMQKMGPELKEQEERIQRKRALLEAAGVELDLSHIKISKETRMDMQGTENMSMWEKMQSMEASFNKLKEYQDRIEAAYDEAIGELDMN